MTALAITPATLTEALGDLKPCDTLACEGVFPFLKAKLPEGVTILGGTWAGLRLDGARGLTIRAGELRGSGAGNGLTILDGSDITLDDVLIADFARGASFSRCDRVKVTEAQIRRMVIDGLDFGGCHDVEVNRTSVTGSLAVPGGAHPDGVQFWSKPGLKPSCNLKVTDSLFVGAMQGVTAFNHVRAGLDDGGFDNVEIARNRVIVSRPNGITVEDGRGVSIHDNHVSTYESPITTGWAHILLTRCRDAVRAGNRVDAWTKPGGRIYAADHDLAK